MMPSLLIHRLPKQEMNPMVILIPACLPGG